MQLKDLYINEDTITILTRIFPDHYTIFRDHNDIFHCTSRIGIPDRETWEYTKLAILEEIGYNLEFNPTKTSSLVDNKNFTITYVDWLALID